MHLALNAAQMKNVDLYMMESMRIPSILLMENAANGIYREINKRIEPCVVHVYCGVGNNGGDGLAAARILMANGYHVYVIVAGEPDKMTPDTLTNYAMFREMPKQACCITNSDQLKELQLPEPDVVVDALIGVGLTRGVQGFYADIISEINSYEDALVVSVDIPSGVSADTGAALGEAVKADVTVTFQHPKIGLYLYPGKAYAGEVEIVKIGIDTECDELKHAHVGVITKDEQKLFLPRRRLGANKGDFGRLLLIAGSDGMAGAAVMAAQAASRAGVGLVTLASTQEVVRAAQISVPQATCVTLPQEGGTISKSAMGIISRALEGKSAIAVGPGLGCNDETRAIVQNLLTDYDIPKVLDADAINALAGQRMLLEHKVGRVILTPHPVEFARLLNKDVEEVLADPIRWAIDFAVQYSLILVLKGAATIVAVPKGNAFIISEGTPGMAKGGSGDVLTGIISGLAAQGIAMTRCAYIGVMIAAMAGEAAAEKFGEYSMTPVDEINEIGAAAGYWQTYAPEPEPVVRQKAAKQLKPEVISITDATAPLPQVRQEHGEPAAGAAEQATEASNRPEEEPKIQEEHKKMTIADRIVAGFGKKTDNAEEPPHENTPPVPVKSAEQAIAEIEAAESRGKSKGTVTGGTQEIKRGEITEIIEIEEPEEPKKPPTGTGRRRIG